MSGVPQGSVLGPHLYIIFVNDLFYNVKDAKLSAYADEKQLYFSHKEALTLQHTLNSELAIVSSWISDNGRILNAKNCESLLFRRPKAQCNQMNEEDISFSVNGTVIKAHMSCKLLGVHIDDNLNLSKHVASLCKETSKQVAIISRFKKLLSTTTKYFCTKPIVYLILPIAPLYGCIVAKQQLANSKS